MRVLAFYVFALLILCSLIINCEKKLTNATEVVIDLKQANEINASEIVASTHYVKLGDINANCPSFYPITKLGITKDRLFVFHKKIGNFSCNVLSFDKQGNYLFHLEGESNTPNSIKTVTDIDVYEDRLELLDVAKQVIVSYDQDGKRIGIQPFMEPYSKFKRLSSNKIIFDADNSGMKNGHALAVWNTQQDDPSYFLERIQGFDIGSYANRFQLNDQGDLLYWRACDPNIYQIAKKKSQVSIKYAVKYKNLWIDHTEFKDEGIGVLKAYNNNEGVFTIDNVFETNKHLFVFNTYKQMLNWTIFDKSNKKMRVFKIKGNNFDGGPIPSSPPLAMIPPSTFVFGLDTEEVIQRAKNKITPTKKNKFYFFAEKIKNQDNPCLLFLELKL